MAAERQAGERPSGSLLRTTGLSRPPDLMIRISTLKVMVWKNFIVMMRYPVSFFSGFLSIFLILAMFIIAVWLFLPEPMGAEWEGALTYGEGNATISLIETEDNRTVLFIGSEVNWHPPFQELFVVQNGTWNGTWNGTGTIVPSGYCADTYCVDVTPSPDWYPDPDNGTGGEWLLPDAPWTIRFDAVGESVVLSNQDPSDGTARPLELNTSTITLDGIQGAPVVIDNSFGGITMFGFVLFMFMSDILWNLGFSIRDEQDQGTLEALYVTPASKFSSVISRALVGTATIGVFNIAALGAIQLFTPGIPFENIGLGLYILVFSLAMLFGLGFFMVGVSFRVKASIELILNSFQFVALILCAMMFPFSVLPDVVVDYGSRWIPLSYSVDAFRSAMVGTTPELAPMWLEIILVTGFGILFPILGYWWYRVSEQATKKAGTFSTY